MKTWFDLSETTQQAVLAAQADQVLAALVIGALRFDDERNGDSLQRRIDEAIEAASNGEPQEAGRIIMERCGEDLLPFIERHCQRAIYVSPEELVIQLSVEEYTTAEKE